MNLQDLNSLAATAQNEFDNYHKQEIALSTEFKNDFSEVLNRKSGDKISYSKFTSIIETSSGLTITFPNQWFFIASYFVDFLIALKEYKKYYNNIFKGIIDVKTKVEQIRSNAMIPIDVENRIRTYLSDPKDLEYFNQFITNYSWWFGSKTIDRSDYYVSPVLSLAKVVNVSQSYIADLAFFLSDNPYLLISLRKSTLSIASPALLQPIQSNFDHNVFYNDARDANLFISKSTSLRFISSLLTKPFVILTGLSGSGKTKLAQAFATWICENQNQYCIIPVGADWINREPLLGFPNSLDDTKYVKPDNGVLDLIIKASKQENQTKPYFLILDEMNLSHVERYFADFLSIMESQDSKGILLHSDIERKDTNDNSVPNSIRLPSNLFIIGTVNIDETTYMFSPKVLDRANVIEFRLTQKEMEDFFQGNEKISLENLQALGAPMASSFVSLAINKELRIEKAKTEITETLLNFFDELKMIGAEFGYRSASEILRFGAVVNNLETDWTSRQIIDAAIMQKLLPKLHGSRSRLVKVLIALGQLCLSDDRDVKKEIFDKHNKIDFENEPNIFYRLSLEKISRMHKNVVENGFTSYAEA